MIETGFLYQFIARQVAAIRKDLKPAEELSPEWLELASIPELLQGTISCRFEARRIVID